MGIYSGWWKMKKIGGGEGAIDIKDAWSPCLPCMRKSNLGKC